MSDGSQDEGRSGNPVPVSAHDTTPGGDGLDVEEAKRLLVVIPKVTYNEKLARKSLFLKLSRIT